jgi:hypothetical protein
MAYDTTLADRMRPYLLGRAGMSERSMFGGLGFLLYGNLCCGIWKDQLIIRLSPHETAGALKEKHVHVFDITGKPMKGWLLIDPAGIKKDTDLYAWIERAVSFVSTMPKK